MATKINGANQIQAGTVTRSLFNTSTTGSAVITKIIAGTNISFSQTGIDAGTGDVTINSSTAYQKASVVDANYTVKTTDQMVAFSSITAARAITLPAASTFPKQRLLIVDESGSCSATNSIAITPNSGDTINGSASTIFVTSPYGYIELESNAGTKWIITDTWTAGMAQQSPSSVAITGGTINSTTLGATTPAAASVTSLTTTGLVTISSATSGSAGVINKVNLFGGTYGVGVSAASIDYIVPSGSSHNWYIGATKQITISSSGITINTGTLSLAGAISSGPVTATGAISASTTLTSGAQTSAGGLVIPILNATDSNISNIRVKNPGTTYATTVGTTQSSASTTLVVTSATNLAVGQYIFGTNIPFPCTILSISSNTLTLSAATTAALTSGQALTFNAVGYDVIHRYDGSSYYMLRTQTGNFSYDTTRPLNYNLNNNSISLMSDGTGTISLGGPTTLQSTVTLSATSPLAISTGSLSATAGVVNKVNLYGGTYGVGVSTNSFDYMAAAAAAHNFYIGSTVVETLTATGINNTAVGATTPSTGAFTSLKTSAVLASNDSSTNAAYTAWVQSLVAPFTNSIAGTKPLSYYSGSTADAQFASWISSGDRSVKLDRDITITALVTLPSYGHIFGDGHIVTKGYNGDMFDMTAQSCGMYNIILSGNRTAGLFTGRGIVIGGTGAQSTTTYQRLYDVNISDTDGYALEFTASCAGGQFTWVGGYAVRYLDPNGPRTTLPNNVSVLTAQLNSSSIKLPGNGVVTYPSGVYTSDASNDVQTYGYRRFLFIDSGGTNLINFAGGNCTDMLYCTAFNSTYADATRYAKWTGGRHVYAPTLAGTGVYFDDTVTVDGDGAALTLNPKCNECRIKLCSNVLTWVDNSGNVNNQIWDNCPRPFSSTFTPTINSPSAFAIGNGSITGSIIRRGSQIDIKFKLVIGSTSNFGTGAWNFTVPAPYASSFTHSSDAVGLAFTNAGGNFTQGVAIMFAGSANIQIYPGNNTGGAWSPTVPQYMTPGQYMEFNLIFDID